MKNTERFTLGFVPDVQTKHRYDNHGRLLSTYYQHSRYAIIDSDGSVFYENKEDSKDEIELKPIYLEMISKLNEEDNRYKEILKSYLK